MICDTMSSYLSMSNLCVKTHNRFLPEAQPRNLLAVDKLNDKTKLTENNNQISNGNDKLVQQVWSKYSFQTNSFGVKSFSDEGIKMSWADTTPPEQEVEEVESAASSAIVVEDEPADKDVEVVSPPPAVAEDKEAEEAAAAASPAHHARRPMNAFLIFCKKHRPIVRDRYPNLENRGVTKILGEWWALLEQTDKAPYTELAKEYKDAFLSANPNFKWYKLPAPPLRTLNVRPTVNNNKAPSPVSSPTHCESEFTPGKLADESQLGSLTSLLNNNYTTSSSVKTTTSSPPPESETNNNLCCDSSSPVNLIKTSLPPKPIKKRIFEKYLDNNKHVARNLLEDISEANDDDDSVTTKQDLVDSVVDEMYNQSNEYDPNVRKSGRQCKGKLYEKFMVEGKLLGNKRDARLTSQKSPSAEEVEAANKTETPNLNCTIKRLAERTNMKNFIEHQEQVRTRTNSETSDSSCGGGKCATNNFNLDLRISELSSLSYDVFSQRKRDSKKRKNRIRTDGGSDAKKPKMLQMENQQLVGSKKRKNKQSITHLEKKDDDITSFLGLATLAEVAAQTQKIDEQEKISE